VLFVCRKSGANAERTPFAPVTFGGKRRAEKEKEISGPGRPCNLPANQSVPTSNQIAAKRPRVSNIVADRGQVSSLQDTGPLSAKPDAPNFVLPALRIAKSATEQVRLFQQIQKGYNGFKSFMPFAHSWDVLKIVQKRK